MRAPFLLALTALGLSAVAFPARAQSLGDLARQEAERRKALQEPSRVITNKDVPAVAQPQPSATKPADGAKPADGDKTATDAAKTDDTKPASTETKDQKYWSDRHKGLLTQLERDQMFAQALQSRINALWTDFVNRDDPAQKALIEADRNRALAELDRLNAAIDSDEKAIADFEEEARRAAVPPGWLR